MNVTVKGKINAKEYGMRTKLMTVVMLAAAATLWAQSPRAVIRSVQGTVEVKAPGAAAWQPASAGQELEEATLVSTGFKSSALLEIGNSTLTVRPLTRLSLKEIRSAAEAERVEIQLSAGRIRADVKPPAGRNVNFTVRAPIATASVRGTVFDFDTINLNVDEGTVSFSGADNTAVYVAAGQTSAPDPVSGKTAAPVEIVEAQAPPPPAGVDTVEAAPPEPMSVQPVPVGLGLGW
jgi:hypothetical protein